MTGESPLVQDRDAGLVRVGEHRVEIAYDPDGEIWYVRASSVPGLTGQAASEDELRAMLPLLVRQAELP